MARPSGRPSADHDLAADQVAWLGSLSPPAQPSPPKPEPHRQIPRDLDGLLDSAGGDLDRAVHTLTAAVDHNTDAGFCPSQPPPPGNSPPTLHLNRPGDRENAAHHTADAAALTMRINSEVGI
jgi:hypothetical protein